jgi:hypothetical protein
MSDFVVGTGTQFCTAVHKICRFRLHACFLATPNVGPVMGDLCELAVIVIRMQLALLSQTCTSLAFMFSIMHPCKKKPCGLR